MCRVAKLPANPYTAVIFGEPLLRPAVTNEYCVAPAAFPLDMMTTHRFGLSEVEHAIKSVGGQGAPGAIRVSAMPWA
jgi:hypothetical protein